MENEATHGYICKQCGDTAPSGIGYTSFDPRHIAASPTINACACGYSQRCTN